MGAVVVACVWAVCVCVMVARPLSLLLFRPVRAGRIPNTDVSRRHGRDMASEDRQTYGEHRKEKQSIQDESIRRWNDVM